MCINTRGTFGSCDLLYKHRLLNTPVCKKAKIFTQIFNAPALCFDMAIGHLTIYIYYVWMESIYGKNIKAYK